MGTDAAVEAGFVGGVNALGDKLYSGVRYVAGDFVHWPLQPEPTLRARAEREHLFVSAKPPHTSAGSRPRTRSRPLIINH